MRDVFPVVIISLIMCFLVEYLLFRNVPAEGIYLIVNVGALIIVPLSFSALVLDDVWAVVRAKYVQYS